MSIEEAHEADVETDDAPSAEDISRAREMGWVPPEEWKGAPPKNGFLDPREFVRRGEKIMPIVRAEAKKWQSEAESLKRELQAAREEHRDTVRRIERMSMVALEQQRAQIEASYAAKIDMAAASGDTDAVRQARKEEKEALAALDKRLEEPEEEKKAREKKATETSVPADVQKWLDANPWYESDDELKAVATARHVKLLKEKPGLSLAENLEDVRKYVAKKYPEHFSVANEEEEGSEDERPARRGSPVEGGARLSGGASRSLYSKLPAEAKAAADRFIKEQGLFLEKGETIEKDMAKARERYAAQYLENEK